MTIGADIRDIEATGEDFRFPEQIKNGELSSSSEKSSIALEEEAVGLARGMRDLRYSELIDKMRNDPESLSDTEKDQIKHSLERRKWGGVLRNLHKGDKVVTILSSTSDLLSIKNLNDNIFGPQTTDGIIAKRRELSEAYLKLALKLAGVDTKDLEHVSLEQNYKLGIFSIPAKYDIDLNSILNNVCSQVDEEMKKYIIHLADEEQSKYPEKTTALQNFRVAVNNEGYRVTFGTAEVKSDNLEDLIATTSESLQFARISTFNRDSYGGDFSSKESDLAISDIIQHQNNIYLKNNTITNSDGISIEIFTKEAGKLKINRDLLRDLRKDKFLVKPGQEDLLKTLKEYIKKLNIFDVVKPFTADEINKIEAESKEVDDIVVGLSENNPEKIAIAADILDRSEKDPKYTSETKFHAEAVKNKNCAYISLDVLDVGVDQLLDFEERIQLVANKELTFARASLEAGDLITKRLREVRNKVYSICNEFQLTKNGRMDGLIGGDELTLAINLDATDNDGNKIFDKNDKILNAFIHRIKKETNGRIIKTVIAESKRHSKTNNDIQRMKEHLVAIKKAEQGSSQAKQAEEELRKLKKYIGQNQTNNDAIKIMDKLENFVMTEADGHFVIHTEDGESFTIEELKFFLNSFYK